MKEQHNALDSLRKLYREQEKTALKDYFTFLKFQSISSEAAYKSEVSACASWLSNYLKEIGFHVELWPTQGHPTLFASHMKAGPDKPTLLLYHHYDVQPVDPLSEWASPPFEPDIRGNQVFARGANDNKGQCFYTINALKALLQRDKELPINVKLCIEGEEECGSTGLSGILSSKKNELRADYLAIVDLGIPDLQTPAVTLGIRGLVTMDVEVLGTHTDLHSGSHGGLAYNPIHALVEILAKLRDSSGKITVPGFYDDVIPLDEKERTQIALNFSEDEYQKMFGAYPSGGEKAFSPKERVWTRPTIEINGIFGGYSGSGFKTVIPSKAGAKISCRLVPNQDPDRIAEKVSKFIIAQAPKGTSVKVHIHPGKGKAVRANPSSKISKAFSQAYSEVFQKPCQFIFEGGSIPISTELAHASGSEIILVGLGLQDDQVHAPNEHFGLDRLEMGFLIIARTLQLLQGE